MTPTNAELKFTKEHEWVRLQGEEAWVGITDYAQDQLGDIVFVELPAVGTEVQAGDTCASIESIKAVSEVYAPLTGEIVEVNGTLETEPESLNNDPYTAFIVKMKTSDTAALETLMDEKAYQEYVAGL